MFKNIMLCAILSVFLYSKDKPREYMIINVNDWILGTIKLDINFTNGSFGSTFGVFLDDNTIITSSAIANLGFPNEINVKIKDKEADLIICIAKARLVVSDTNDALAMLKIEHYTDDYCNYSPKKAYHGELISSQKINIHTTKKPIDIEPIGDKSPFLVKNCNQTMIYEQGFPYFDKKGSFIGISSNNRIIKVNDINRFMKNIKNENLN